MPGFLNHRLRAASGCRPMSQTSWPLPQARQQELWQRQAGQVVAKPVPARVTVAAARLPVRVQAQAAVKAAAELPGAAVLQPVLEAEEVVAVAVDRKSVV